MKTIGKASIRKNGKLQHSKLHTCEICGDFFTPRPQIKNPRACEKKSCQKARQRLNEREWREKNRPFIDPSYFRLKRQERHKVLRRITDKLFECLRIGNTFLGSPVNLDKLRTFFFQFLKALGIRTAKKFCRPSKDPLDNGCVPVIEGQEFANQFMDSLANTRYFSPT